VEHVHVTENQMELLVVIFGEYDVTQSFCHAIQESSQEFCVFRIEKL
jgi:hypothetical protein